MLPKHSTEMDVDEVFNTFKVPAGKSPQLDVVIENYLNMTNQLRKDINDLRGEISLHKKVDVNSKDSLEDYNLIQKLSSTVTQGQSYEKILYTLKEISQKIIPHKFGEMFLVIEGELSSVRKIPNSDFKLLLKILKEEGIIDWLWNQGHPIVVPPKDFVVYDKMSIKKGNFVVVPMIQNSKGIGVYLFHTEKDKSDFSLKDLELLNIISNQAGIAIQHTNLCQQMETMQNILKESQKELLKVFKLATVGEIAGGIAHEINNPLQVIMGNIQIARMGRKVDESLKTVESQTMRIANIVRGLLNMAKQKNDSSNDFVEINPLIINTIDLVKGQIENRGINIQLDLSEKLPIIKCRAIYLQQILLNFILHSKNQIGRDGSIGISSRKTENDGVEIEITDSGAPLPVEYIEKVMEPFMNLRNSAETNLGLIVSVQMVNDIGGKVKIQSVKNNNSIIIHLPHRIERVEGEESQEALSLA